MPPADALPSGCGRPTRAEIDLEAFESNLRLAVRLSGEEREVMAVVKADAYGHGALPLVRRALTAGVSSFGVATVDEARQLRDAGVTAPVFILSEVEPSSAAEVVRLRCTPVLYSLPLAEALERAANRAGRRLPVHLKVDTGMGRVGVAPREAAPLAARLAGMPHLVLEGLLSHLSDADRLDSAATGRQLKIFHEVSRQVAGDHPELRCRHIANSALLMRGEAAGELTRPGIMLYGSPPAPGFPGEGDLRPVMRFVTALSFLKKVPAGTPLSYGGTSVTTRESIIATLPVGYADGYPRRLSNRAQVLVRGRRAPQVGRICMDMCLIDVTDIPGAAVGDEAVLFGSQGGETVTVEELAALLETISYEVYCGVGCRVPRVCLGDDAPAGTG